MRKMRKIGHVFAFIAIFAGIIAIVMLLWNALIPSIIGWSAINYWQAAGLMVLSRLLFGGFGRHWHGHRGWHHHKGHKHLHEKLQGMSREEKREYIRQRMAGFGGWDGDERPSDTENAER